MDIRRQIHEYVLRKFKALSMCLINFEREQKKNSKNRNKHSHRKEETYWWNKNIEKICSEQFLLEEPLAEQLRKKRRREINNI